MNVRRYQTTIGFWDSCTVNGAKDLTANVSSCPIPSADIATEMRTDYEAAEALRKSAVVSSNLLACSSGPTQCAAALALPVFLEDNDKVVLVSAVLLALGVLSLPATASAAAVGATLIGMKLFVAGLVLDVRAEEKRHEYNNYILSIEDSDLPLIPPSPYPTEPSPGLRPLGVSGRESTNSVKPASSLSLAPQTRSISRLSSDRGFSYSDRSLVEKAAAFVDEQSLREQEAEYFLGFAEAAANYLHASEGFKDAATNFYKKAFDPSLSHEDQAKLLEAIHSVYDFYDAQEDRADDAHILGAWLDSAPEFLELSESELSNSSFDQERALENLRLVANGQFDETLLDILVSEGVVLGIEEARAGIASLAVETQTWLATDSADVLPAGDLSAEALEITVDPSKPLPLLPLGISDIPVLNIPLLLRALESR